MAFFLGTILLTAIALLLIPKKYSSEGKLFVSLGRGGVTLDPTATTGRTITIQETREAEINSVTDILTSRGVLEKVIADPEIGADRILETDFVLAKIPLPSFSMFSSKAKSKEYEELEKKELAIQKLYQNLYTHVPRQAATVSVVCKSESPELSQKIVETLMKVYVREHVNARKTDGSFDFFQSQHEIQREELKKATEALSEFKNKIGVMSIDARRATLRDKITTIEKSLISAGTSLAAAENRQKTSKQLLVDIPDQLLIEEMDGVAKEASDLMRDRLYQLELLEKQLLAKYTPSHPQVVAIRGQVEEAKEIMKLQPEDRKVTKKGVNKNRQSFKLEMMNNEVVASGIQAEKTALQVKLEMALAEMQALNRDEIRFAELSRAADVAEKNFRAYADKLEEARINQELDEKNISNVKIVQEATLQVKHISPRRGMILALVTLFSGFSSVCLSVVTDRLGGTLNAPEDIVEVLKLDLLASVPEVETNKNPLLITREES